MLEWPHDGLSLQVFPLRAVGNVVYKGFRVEALEAEQHSALKEYQSIDYLIYNQIKFLI